MGFFVKLKYAQSCDLAVAEMTNRPNKEDLSAEDLRRRADAAMRQQAAR
jgi:hypothetical protein